MNVVRMEAFLQQRNNPWRDEPYFRDDERLVARCLAASVLGIDRRCAPLAHMVAIHSSGLRAATSCRAPGPRTDVARPVGSAAETVRPPCELSEWQIHGDMHARLTWVLGSSSLGGCDVTCRWEIEPMFAGPDWVRTVACLLLERSHFGRMRACARDMGVELRCNSARLREWSGLTHR
jgi:hypothetical protein